MPATKKNSTQELIEELLRVLESQRRLGSEAYPLPLQQLRTLTDHSLTDKKFYTAIGKRHLRSVLLSLTLPAPSVTRVRGISLPSKRMPYGLRPIPDY